MEDNDLFKDANIFRSFLGRKKRLKGSILRDPSLVINPCLSDKDFEDEIKNDDLLKVMKYIKGYTEIDRKRVFRFLLYILENTDVTETRSIGQHMVKLIPDQLFRAWVLIAFLSKFEEFHPMKNFLSLRYLEDLGEVIEMAFTIRGKTLLLKEQSIIVSEIEYDIDNRLDEIMTGKTPDVWICLYNACATFSMTVSILNDRDVPKKYWRMDLTEKEISRNKLKLEKTDIQSFIFSATNLTMISGYPKYCIAMISLVTTGRLNWVTRVCFEERLQNRGKILSKATKSAYKGLKKFVRQKTLEEGSEANDNNLSFNDSEATKILLIFLTVIKNFNQKMNIRSMSSYYVRSVVNAQGCFFMDSFSVLTPYSRVIRIGHFDSDLSINKNSDPILRQLYVCFSVFYDLKEPHPVTFRKIFKSSTLNFIDKLDNFIGYPKEEEIHSKALYLKSLIQEKYGDRKKVQAQPIRFNVLNPGKNAPQRQEINNGSEEAAAMERDRIEEEEERSQVSEQTKISRSKKA